MTSFSDNPTVPFPALYHAHHSRHMEDLPFWIELADANQRSHPEPILELGCGTGRILLPVARAGHMVYGLDNDQLMLRYLLQQVKQEEQALILVVQADMTQFHFAARFRLIMLPCNTLSILSQPDMQELFQCVSRHLAPGSVFAASLPNPQLLLHMTKKSAREFEEVFPHPVDGGPIEVSSAWQHDDKTFTITWFYDHRLVDGIIDHLETSIQHQIHPVDFYKKALEESGFGSIQLFGDYDRRPYRKASPNLILVATIL